MLVLARIFTNLLCASFNCDFLNPVPEPLQFLSLQRPRDLFKPEPFVVTKSGAVEGYFMHIIDGREIYAFEGIPYAQQIKRFEAALPIEPWEGVRSAKKTGPDCLQMHELKLFRVVGKENCLYLNIYTPQIPSKNVNNQTVLPVILHIHGGFFMFGSGAEFGPSYFLQEDVILVTINYRLGVLGFLSTGDENASGNWGLRDQSLAIKWVHDNIEAFGGDVSKISLSGQSAGAVSAHLQMISTTSVGRGLFSSAITLSGSAFHKWGLQLPKYARMMTEALADVVGCPVNQGNKALIKCLRQVDANFLVAAQRQLHVTTIFPIMLFAPVIEPNITGAFIVDSPDNYYKNDLVMKIPFISTSVAQESNVILMLMDNLLMRNYYVRNWRPLVAFLYDYGRYVDDPKEATEILAAAYFGKENIRDNGLLLDFEKIKEWGSDSYFTVANRNALKAHSKTAPTYSFNYGCVSESGMATLLFQDYRKWEATHMDELAALFNASFFFTPLKENTMHYEVSRVLVNLLTNFAKTGEPIYTNNEHGMPQDFWKPITNASDLKFLKIGNDGTFKMVNESSDKIRILKVWEDLGF